MKISDFSIKIIWSKARKAYFLLSNGCAIYAKVIILVLVEQNAQGSELLAAIWENKINILGTVLHLKRIVLAGSFSESSRGEQKWIVFFFPHFVRRPDSSSWDDNPNSTVATQILQWAHLLRDTWHYYGREANHPSTVMQVHLFRVLVTPREMLSRVWAIYFSHEFIVQSCF